MMTHNEMIAVIQAHADGKKIRSREIGSNKWFSGGTPNFDFHRCEFEIEPEPRSLWVVKDDTGIYDTLEVESEALAYLVDDPTWTITEYKEVIKP